MCGTQESEREQRIEKEKAEGGPDPRIVEMEALGAQVAPRGTVRNEAYMASSRCRIMRALS